MLVMSRFIILGLSTVLLSGCFNNGPERLGADAGILKYNAPSSNIENDEIVATAVSPSLKDKLKKSDLSHLHKAQQTAFQQKRGGVPIAWKNKFTRHSGQVVSGLAYTINGRQCRNFTNIIIIDKKRQSESGIVCLERDGVWQELTS